MPEKICNATFLGGVIFSGPEDINYQGRRGLGNPKLRVQLSVGCGWHENALLCFELYLVACSS